MSATSEPYAAPATALRERLRELLGFAAAGGIGFVVDAGLTNALIAFVHLSPLLARAPAVAAAMATTYAINRRYTFKIEGERRRHESLRYVLVAGLGIALNYAAYAASLGPLGALAPHFAVTTLAIMVGVGIGMVWNYFGFRRFVFAPAAS
ncbi:MAG: GtrA family protein [Hyphomicrobiales bacterium]|nr:GtrA family protein [Hyphomicrobiales bacterium]MDE2017681.1 GtrA family protein [Hyphomicrobiales bacterium]